MDDKDLKIWELLGAWQNIEPRPGYIERFKARVAQRKTWQERFWEGVKEQFSFKQYILKPVLALGIFIIIFVSAQNYNIYVNTKDLLTNLDENQWEMLANYETVSKLDLVKEL